MKSNSEIASENLKKHTAELLQVLDDTLKITIILDWLAEKLDKKEKLIKNIILNYLGGK